MEKGCFANQMLWIVFYSLRRDRMFTERKWILFLGLFILYSEGIGTYLALSPIPCSLCLSSLPQIYAGFALQQEP